MAIRLSQATDLNQAVDLMDDLPEILNSLAARLVITADTFDDAALDESQAIAGAEFDGLDGEVFVMIATDLVGEC